MVTQLEIEPMTTRFLVVALTTKLLGRLLLLQRMVLWVLPPFPPTQSDDGEFHNKPAHAAPVASALPLAQHRGAEDGELRDNLAWPFGTAKPRRLFFLKKNAY